tara:strand:+ start:34126 stop:34992 length:867 start_codon:yes stop_codon:yes gene_type:complete
MRFLEFFILILLSTCISSEYTRLSERISKKLLLFGEGNKSVGEASYLDINFSTETVSKGEDLKENSHLLLSDFDVSMFGSPTLSSDISKLVAGDSVEYIVTYSAIKNSILDQFINEEVVLTDTQKVSLNIGFNLVMSKEEYMAFREKEVRTGLALEMELIEDYILSEGLSRRLTRKGDLFYMKTLENTSEKVLSSDDLAISYTCSFINGHVFNKVSEEEPLYLNLSSSDQVIKGIESILKEMNEGEACRIIVPSYLGFGANGSSDGTVPPHTPILADVKVVEIIKSQP